MQKKNNLYPTGLAFFIFSLIFANFSEIVAKPLGKHIDATHILAKEIELPKRIFKPGFESYSPSRSVSVTASVDSNMKTPSIKTKVYQLGDLEQFWARNMEANNFEQITAVLRAVGENCYIFVEDTQSVSQSAVDRIKEQFDTVIYPVNTRHFGLEAKPGIDGDNRVFLLMLDIKDGYKDSDDGYVAGYFFAGDQMYQKEFPNYSNTKSNEKEIMYIDTWPCDPDDNDYLEIVAHEFQHMIHYNQDNEEVTWVNEGCSQIAPVFCGFAPPGHYNLLKEDPDRSLNNWATWNPMPDYGQVYLWNQYIVDRLLHSFSDRVNFFKTLTGSKKKSIGGYIDALKPFEASFTNLFTDFAITNRINDFKVNDGRFAYKHSALRNFKLPPTKQITTFPTKISDSVYIWGSDSFFADISGISGELKISFSVYRRRIDSSYPFFRVAVIKHDSTSKNSPELGFFKLSVKPDDNNRLTGTYKINCHGKYDSLTTIVIALAPEKLDDTEYMPVSGFIYDLIFETDKPAVNVVRASHSIDIPTFVTAVNDIRSSESEAAFRLREHYATILLRAVKADSERGSLQTVDDFIESVSDNKKLFASFAGDIAEILNFMYSHQNITVSSKEIQTRIDSLHEITGAR